jgi:hypothetical protein
MNKFCLRLPSMFGAFLKHRIMQIDHIFRDTRTGRTAGNKAAESKTECKKKEKNTKSVPIKRELG